MVAEITTFDEAVRFLKQKQSDRDISLVKMEEETGIHRSHLSVLLSAKKHRTLISYAKKKAAAGA